MKSIESLKDILDQNNVISVTKEKKSNLYKIQIPKDDLLYILKNNSKYVKQTNNVSNNYYKMTTVYFKDVILWCYEALYTNVEEIYKKEEK